MRVAVLRNEKGQFERTRGVWSPEKWDDGVLLNSGRVKVYRPDYPGAWASGYALRSHVVWWLETGEVVRPGEVLHHENEVKTDDRFENLVKETHEEHSRRHNRSRKNDVTLICVECGSTYVLPAWRAKVRKGYCSRACYNGRSR